jgi:hypothetical protein
MNLYDFLRMAGHGILYRFDYSVDHDLGLIAY